MEPARRRRPATAAAAPPPASRAARNANIEAAQIAGSGATRYSSPRGLVGFGRLRMRHLDHGIGHEMPALGSVKLLLIGLRAAIGPFAFFPRPLGFDFLPFPSGHGRPAGDRQ